MPYVYKIKGPLMLLQVIHTLTTGFPMVNVFEGIAFSK